MTATKAGTLQQHISGNHDRAARVYRNVILTFLQVMSQSDTRSEQIWKLRLFAHLNTRALSEALLARWAAEEVLEVAEGCRSMIWNRVLCRKASVKDLEARHQDLATRFVEARALLARSSNAVAASAANSDNSWGGLLASNQFHVADQYNKVLAEIRQQPGFEDFLLPGFSAQRLQSISSEGPIVMFVRSNVSHALIISQAGILVQALPEFSRKRCEERYEAFKTFLEVRKLDSSKAQEILEDLLEWLWKTAAGPVITAMTSAGLCQPGPQAADSRLPRLWWVSSGWISVFPIHVAGEYKSQAAPGERRHVFDFFVSSYTPSLGALEYARMTMHRMSSAASADSSIPLPEAALISMKFTPDVSPDLNQAPDEVRETERILRREYKIVTMGHPKEDFQSVPSRKLVVQALRTCEIAHFACHGVADPLEPLRSKLLLWDWERRPLTVGFLMRMDFESCRLVNLSACDMAVNRDLLLREESLHMAGAFQMSGVPNVLATMWPIVDSVAPQVSRGIYSDLLGSDGRFQFANIATALHKVAMGLWKRGESVIVWDPYVHFGA